MTYLHIAITHRHKLFDSGGAIIFVSKAIEVRSRLKPFFGFFKLSSVLCVLRRLTTLQRKMGSFAWIITGATQLFSPVQAVRCLRKAQRA